MTDPTQDSLLDKIPNRSSENGAKSQFVGISNEEAQSLLTLVDVVRDPLHGDIQLTALERVIVDTPEFQRLRNINQLAMTYIAYPGAVHTRFIHSLGTLYVCAELIETCNKNAAIYSTGKEFNHPVPVAVGSYATLLARLCALMHDLAHVPFGHTFEKEARIFDKDEWQDPEREELLLGDKSSLSDCFREFFKSRDLTHDGADALRKDIRDVLKTKRAAVATLKYPFVHDLVGNTICADLIDYVRRDMYYCGLTETFGDRFLKYVAVFPVNPAPKELVTGDKDIDESPRLTPVMVADEEAFESRTHEGNDEFCRVVLMGYRYNERGRAVRKPDVFGEAIDLVRRRLAVAQKLYFHRTKIVASAMLAEAAVSAGFKNAMEIWDKSDQEVLKWLRDEAVDERANCIAKRIIERRLFKPIYRVSYHPDDGSDTALEVWRAYDKFKNPKKRHDLVERLERIIDCMWPSPDGPRRGTAAISCPDKSMGLKAFDMLVTRYPGAEIQKLQVSKHPPTKLEILAVQTTHEYLWCLEVFVDPRIVKLKNSDPKTVELAGAIQQFIGPPNDLTEFHGAPGKDLAELEREYLIDSKLQVLGLTEAITAVHYEELTSVAMRSWGKEGDSDEVLITFLKGKGYTINE